MRFNHLTDWLAWQEKLNPREIDLGLDRVARVLTQAGLANTFDCPLITVAGTNGKGSVVAMLEAVAMAAGLKVCSYTSPHIFRYNERIKINGQPVSDDRLCEAFDRIDQARSGESSEAQLTYFEFGTLAAIEIFTELSPDLIILEVGLGGRLDAVNIMEADVSVLTSVAIDHVDWLGDDREKIGFEKAGIFRRGQTVICGEFDPPASVIEHAQRLQCEFIQAGKHYRVDEENDSDVQVRSWKLVSDFGDIAGLPEPSLSGAFQRNNAATAIMALQVLERKSLLFSSSKSGSKIVSNHDLNLAIKTGLGNINLPGRFQLINAEPQVYVDVAHNPHAAQALASQLKSGQRDGRNKTWAIVAMLSDKDTDGVLANIADCIDFWCFAGLDNIARGMSAEVFIERLKSSADGLSAGCDYEFEAELGDEFRANKCTMLSDKVMVASTVTQACQSVLSKAEIDDRVIIFGSFYTVAEAMQFFSRLNKGVEELNS